MKKIIAFAIVATQLIAFHTTTAQYNNAAKIGGYSGTDGVQLNPAKALSQRQKYSISLFHLDFGVNNNARKFGLDSLIAGEVNMTSLPNKNISLVAPMLEIGLPSFYFVLKDKMAFGFQSRFRLFNQLHNANPFLINYLVNNNQIADLKSIDDPVGFNFNVHALMDLGVKGSMTVVDNPLYKINAGAALRYYSGIAYGNFDNAGIKAQIQEFGDSLYILDIDNIDLRVNTTVNQNTGDYFSQFQDFNGIKDKILSFKNPGSGLGMDIGGEFIWKDPKVIDNDGRDYKFLVGASITDLGSMKYRNVTQLMVQGAGTVRSDSLESHNGDLEQIKQYLNRNGLTASLDTNITNKVSLPTMLNLYGDYRISSKFFVGAMARINMTNKQTDNPFYYGSFMVAPRLQMKYIEASLPISYVPMSSDVKVGLGLRMGPLVIGSDDLSILFTDAPGANFFLGLRIDGNLKAHNAAKVKPISNDAIDEIEISDAVEAADSDAGIDTDGDGVIDSLDNCPNKKGSKKNNGC